MDGYRSTGRSSHLSLLAKLPWGPLTDGTWLTHGAEYRWHSITALLRPSRKKVYPNGVSVVGFHSSSVAAGNGPSLPPCWNLGFSPPQSHVCCRHVGRADCMLYRQVPDTFPDKRSPTLHFPTELGTPESERVALHKAEERKKLTHDPSRPHVVLPHRLPKIF